MHSITTRFRGDSRSGVNLDKVVDLLEDHEVKRVLSPAYIAFKLCRIACFLLELIERVRKS